MPAGVTVEGTMRILSSEGGAEGNKMTEIGPSSTGAGGINAQDREEVFVAMLLVAHRRRGAATVFFADRPELEA